MSALSPPKEEIKYPTVYDSPRRARARGFPPLFVTFATEGNIASSSLAAQSESVLSYVDRHIHPSWLPSCFTLQTQHASPKRLKATSEVYGVGTPTTTI